MKKTLTLLIAAAGCAVAEVPADKLVLTLSNLASNDIVQYDISGFKASGTTAIANNTTVALTLNVEAMAAEGGYDLFSLEGLSSYAVTGVVPDQAYRQGVYWNTKKELMAGISKSTTGTLSTTKSLTGISEKTIDWSNISAASFVYVTNENSPNDIYQGYLFLRDMDGHEITYVSEDINANRGNDPGEFSLININTKYVNSVQVYATNLGAADALVLGKSMLPTVPEPTTATLSLLALAGLAARRRRR